MITQNIDTAPPQGRIGAGDRGPRLDPYLELPAGAATRFPLEEVDGLFGDDGAARSARECARSR